MATYDVWDRCVVYGHAEVDAKSKKAAVEMAKQGGITFIYEPSDCRVTATTRPRTDPTTAATPAPEEEG